jgi:hypothetical protein
MKIEYTPEEEAERKRVFDQYEKDLYLFKTKHEADLKIKVLLRYAAIEALPEDQRFYAKTPNLESMHADEHEEVQQ